MRYCKKCQKEHELWYAEPQKGVVSCIPCRRIAGRKSYEKNKANYIYSTRAYRHAHLERIREYQRKYRAKHPEKVRAYSKMRYQRDKIKCLARSALREAILNGKIIRQPCFKCLNWDSEAHHVDYNKPLEVQWLCRLHHMELHRVHK